MITSDTAMLQLEWIQGSFNGRATMHLRLHNLEFSAFELLSTTTFTGLQVSVLLSDLNFRISYGTLYLWSRQVSTSTSCQDRDQMANNCCDNTKQTASNNLS